MFFLSLKKGAFTVALALVTSFSFSQTVQAPVQKKTEAGQLSDSALLDLVQKQTFRYFWDFAHPVSGLARERSNITPVLSALVPVGDF